MCGKLSGKVCQRGGFMVFMRVSEARDERSEVGVLQRVTERIFVEGGAERQRGALLLTLSF